MAFNFKSFALGAIAASIIGGGGYYLGSSSNKMNDDGKAKITPLYSPNPATETYTPKMVEVNYGGVFVTESGKKYHSNRYCSSLKNKYILQVSEESAIEVGRSRCKKCYW